MNDADEPMSIFTSILKDIVEESIPKTLTVPKRLNICKDAIKECNRAKIHRDIQHSKKTSGRNYVTNMNSQTSVKSVFSIFFKLDLL